MTTDGPFIYTPADFLGWALKSGWSPSVLPIGVVYTFQAPVAAALREQPERFVLNTELTVSNASMLMTTDDGPPLLVACLNPGAASMVTQLEHLRFLSGNSPLSAIIVGTAGAIAGPHQVGDTLIAASALRTDRISNCYLTPSATVDADAELTEQLHRAVGDARIVCTWTVPVPYRSTRADLIAARERGAETVEMEIASLFAAGSALKVRTAAAIVVSDVERVDEPAVVDWSDTLAPTLTAVDAAIAAIRHPTLT